MNVVDVTTTYLGVNFPFACLAQKVNELTYISQLSTEKIVVV